MEDYTLGLALFDYLPVIAAGFGLFLICKYCGLLGDYRGAWLLIIPVIAIVGGSLKASWKLIWVVMQVDHKWMSDQLFFFLATAYVLMAAFVIANLRAAREQRPLNPKWWYAAAVIVVSAICLSLYLKTASDGRTWSFLLLSVLSFANLVFLVTLIVHAWKLHKPLAVASFAGNLMLSYALVALARMEQTASLQWIEEILNLASNSLLAVGGWFLLRRLVDSETRRA